MYSKHHCITDITKVKEDIRHIYNHGGQYMTTTLKRELKQMVFTLEEITKVIRHVGSTNSFNGESGNGFNSNGGVEPLYPEVD